MGDLESQPREATERAKQIGRDLAALPARLLSGARIVGSEPPPGWPELRARCVRLSTPDDATRRLSAEIDLLLSQGEV